MTPEQRLIHQMGRIQGELTHRDLYPGGYRVPAPHRSFLAIAWPLLVFELGLIVVLISYAAQMSPLDMVRGVVG